MGEVSLRLAESGARVADGDGHELHLAPDGLEGGDDGGVLLSLLLSSLVACQVPTESDLDENQVALLAVEGVRVWLESWVASGRIHNGIRAGASVHSESVFR